VKLVTFSPPRSSLVDGEETQRLGAVVDGWVVDLYRNNEETLGLSSMLALIDHGQAAVDRAAELVRQARGGQAGGPRSFPLEEVGLLAPFPMPRRNVFCVGLNFASHVEQNAAARGEPVVLPDIPLFFTKPTTAVIGTGASLRLDHRLTQQLDYEVELAVVLSNGGTWLDEADAMSHVLGFTLLNDVSARDLQWRTSQFFYGKGLDSFCPLGPAIVTLDELPAWQDLVLELSVNGELRQKEKAGNMLFSPARALAELSKGITLLPGDVVSLGTPGGCGYQLDPPRFLQPGDVVVCRTQGIGELVNDVVDVAGPAPGLSRLARLQN
jgi:2-keto-4-pentenoate hydratase/2-oxohepta-3-ene-1,7-dioic acid hydratase in catechol pathway